MISKQTNVSDKDRCKVALVCIAKHEDEYIQEWIDYHLKLGFDHIFIYANDWEYQNDNQNVTVYPYPGNSQQLPAYNEFINNNIGIYDWAAFFDVDEFLCLKKHKSVKDFIKCYSKYECIGINWIFFGDNGHRKVEEEDYSVLNRFIKRGKIECREIKSIVKIKPDLHFTHPHSPHDTRVVSTNFRIFKGPCSPKAVNNIAQINHYFVKTVEEYLNNKIPRGRSDTGEIRSIKQSIELFIDRNKNEEKDTYARNYMYGKDTKLMSSLVTNAFAILKNPLQ